MPVLQPTTNIEEISSSGEENDPNPMGQEHMHSSENVPVAQDVEVKKFCSIFKTIKK